MDRSVTFRVAESDVIESLRHSMASRIFRGPTRWVIVSFAILLALLFALNAISGRSQNLAIVLALALPAALALIHLVMTPMMARRHFRQSKALHDDIEVSWDEEGIAMRGRHGHGRYAYDEFHRWSESANLLLLYQSEMLYNIVPKRALGPEKLADLKAQLSRANGPNV